MARIDRYLFREIAGPFALSVLVVVLLVFLFQARRLATAALGLGLTLEDAGLIFISALPPFLVLAIPIAYLLSVLVGLGRLSQDLELVALSAAGAGPFRIARVPILLGLVVSLGSLPIALYGEPYGLQLLHARLVDVGLRNLAGAIRPGVFNEEFRGTALYARETDGETLRDVLLFDERSGDRPVLILARRGELHSEQGAVTFALEEGEMHVGSPPAAGRYDRLRFGSATLGLDAGEEIRQRTKFISPVGQMAGAEILRLAREAGPESPFGRRLEKTYWRRWAFPAMALVFGVVAAAIGVGARSRARAQSALLGLAAVVGYYVLTRIADIVVIKLAGTPILGAWVPNLLLLAAGLIGLARAGRVR